MTPPLSPSSTLLPYDEAGRGRPVVLLHARPTDRTMWRARLPLLADAGVRAIALDLPGHGDAHVPADRAVSPWTDVLDTLDHLGADRFVLAGNSLGALVALQAAVTAPERVEGGEELARELGAGRPVVIPAAGHLAPLEQPTAFCTLLLDFVRRLPNQ
ncbi:alpha/beta fold hydrolase [Streptomyces chrestomyceticus]|uniref:alpha/beta fold hydrolase n=1 Tax=Streptomyces chrestomyceticus TaxID=68185 RepID=UPI00378A8A62